jgi:hypothetical protein
LNEACTLNLVQPSFHRLEQAQTDGLEASMGIVGVADVKTRMRWALHLL